MGSLTFAKDVAPIVFHKCANCHRAGEIGPFPLASYADVKKRAKQIAQVTGSRFMPPWSPVPGYCQFERDRSLSVGEIGVIAQWADEGSIEGSPSDVPPLPAFATGWKLGAPDLVLTLPEPYELAADANNVFRKFVFRVPINGTKYVRAVDFDPGARKVVHHVQIRIDSSGWSRYQDEHDPAPGFEGKMMAGDRDPAGVMLAWTPGFNAPLNNGLVWTLEKGTDLVLEMHLFGNGKPASVRPSIALYFTSQPPDTHPSVLKLAHDTIDIPAGKKDYVNEDEFVLPVEARVLCVSPHAHFLCRDVQSYAILPDGSKIWLLRIADWDFNWQDSYAFSQPIDLPQGTKVRMRLTYDNSAGNPRNPHHPPRRVCFGRNTDDEMGDIAFQLLHRTQQEADLVSQDVQVKEQKNMIAAALHTLDWKPDDAESHYNLGLLYDHQDDIEHALYHYQQAVRLQPENAWAHNNLGNMYHNLHQLDSAVVEFNKALRIDPKDSMAHNNLGLVFLSQGKLDAAAGQFQEALRLNAEFPEAETNLGKVALRRGNSKQAALHFQRALQYNPEYEDARQSLALLQGSPPQGR